VRYVESFRAPRSRPATSFHNDPEVSSLVCSTPGCPAPRLDDSVFEHTTGQKAEQRLENHIASLEKSTDLQGLSKKSRGYSTGVESVGCPRRQRARTCPVAGSFAQAVPNRTPVDNFFRDPLRPVVYTPRPRGRQDSIASFSHETHLPAQCAPAEAQARLSSPDVDASRPGDPQASPRAGPQATLRLSPTL
jgi:hypothetical protein